MNFTDEIQKFEESLIEKRNELDALRTRRQAHMAQTGKARAALNDLRAVLNGEIPPSQKASPRRSVAGVEALETNDETNRPRRGARRDQIVTICSNLGASGAIFRTADILKVLRDVEGEISAGVRSYTYSLMNTLESEGFVVKRGRGKWSLTS